jgi:GR25 family glycosyltransferase involved in LPS biosynthesis
MRIIIKAIKERNQYFDYLKEKIPMAEWCFDEQKSAYHTFVKGLRMAGDDPCVFMEDDVLVCDNFYNRLCSVIKQKPRNIIQFFSMRKDDHRIGSRWDNKFCMNQCHYHPPKVSRFMADFADTWVNRKTDPNGYDLMMRDFMKSRKEKYWIHVPNLVDHRVGVSMIDKRRASTNRQSFTFKE